MKNHIWCLLIGALFLFLIISRWSPCGGRGTEKYRDDEDIERCITDCYEKIVMTAAERCRKLEGDSSDKMIAPYTGSAAFGKCMENLDPAPLKACYARCTQ